MNLTGNHLFIPVYFVGLQEDFFPVEMKDSLVFFLNGEELSLNSAKLVNSGNLKITEVWIGINLKILCLTHVTCWYCGIIPVSYRRGGRFESFYSEFSDNI